ncbi:periplasmic heavy metal sensor [Mesorhizobium sp. J428]|uniref:periplasmic heavy metal sensor n=1 Tax=Mesorhizobium sp. J428 TaxID=2898440 RepID=UPI002151E0C5|nr:periplasmic heavy metal sensor [Mesorhizobium sp. J428]MCR5858179.1 periplasmic heavy metal sensor [Mesorhizobium sp. J428]
MPGRRALAVLLLLSVAVNVFVVTYWAASATRSRMGLIQPVPMAMAYRIAEHLPEPASTNLRARLDALKSMADHQMSLYSDALARSAAILEQKELDQAALRAAIDEARQHRSQIGDALTDAFVSTVAELPAETRKRLVQRFMDKN